MSAAEDEAGPTPDAPERDQLSIQQAGTLLHLPTPTIRSWERRYGMPVADRSRGGHRRYNLAQLDQLRQMRDLIAQGRRPIEAAELVKTGYATGAAPLVEAFLESARELAPDRLEQILDVARQTLGLDRTVDEVLIPAMREIGEWWHAGRIGVSQEHLASNATTAWLSSVVPAGSLRPRPPIILGCGPLDHHTLGLEAIGALLRFRRWDCRLLGARTPAPSLGHVVQATKAAAVILVCHVAAGRAAATEALRSPQLGGTLLFYAGGAFTSSRSRQGVPGRYLGTNFAAAADLVTDTVTTTRAGGSG